MKQTTNYNLKKIELTDSPPDITVHSGNFDIIDEELKRLDDDKVDKEEDKQLSDENYTKDEKDKLADIEEEANNYTHPTGAGNKHVPTGGAAGQVLKYAGTSGTAKWEDETVTDVIDNLTSSDTDKALSAKQGKALSDTIGPLANLLTTIKTSIVNAINSLKEDIDGHLAEEATQNTLGHIKLSDIDAQKIKGIEVDTTNLAHGKTLRYDEDKEKWVIDVGGIGDIYIEGEEIYNFISTHYSDYGTATKEIDHLHLILESSNVNHRVRFVSALPINLTETDVLYFDLENIGDSTNAHSTIVFAQGVLPTSSVTASFDVFKTYISAFERHVVGLDVSNLLGTFYVGVLLRGNSSTSYVSETKVYRIWGE